MEKNKRFVSHIHVRFRDIDAMGHVNNAVMFTYFEEGRKDILLNHMKHLAADGFNFILAHVSCDYIKPILMSSKPKLEMRVTDIGNKSFGFGYRLSDQMDETIVFATGESIQVCFDYQANRSIPVPEALKTMLEQYM